MRRDCAGVVMDRKTEGFRAAFFSIFSILVLLLSAVSAAAVTVVIDHDDEADQIQQMKERSEPDASGYDQEKAYREETAANALNDYHKKLDDYERWKRDGIFSPYRRGYYDYYGYYPTGYYDGCPYNDEDDCDWWEIYVNNWHRRYYCDDDQGHDHCDHDDWDEWNEWYDDKKEEIFDDCADEFDEEWCDDRLDRWHDSPYDGYEDDDDYDHHMDYGWEYGRTSSHHTSHRINYIPEYETYSKVYGAEIPKYRTANSEVLKEVPIYRSETESYYSDGQIPKYELSYPAQEEVPGYK